MSFLYPSFLWALLAVLIPIIIHLLNLQRTVKLDFPSIQFLEAAKKETSSRRNLKHWLVLAARCLFLVFLVFAFSQPFLSKDTQEEDKVNDVIVYIDNSLSMESQPNSELTALEQAKQLAMEWVGIQQEGKSIGLLTNTTFQKYHSQKKLIEAISRIDFSPQSLSFQDIQRKVTEGQQNKKMVLFSDFQKKYFSEINQLKEDSLNWIQLVAINQGEQQNVFIDSSWVDKLDLNTGKTKVYVSVRSYGKDESEKVTVKMYVDGLLVGAGVANTDPNAPSVISFDVNVGESERLGYFQIDDSPISFDNRFYFKLEKSVKQRVVVIDSDRRSFLRDLYADSLLFETHYLTGPTIPEVLKEKLDLIVLRGEAKGFSQVKELVTTGTQLIYIPTETNDLWSSLNQEFQLSTKKGLSKEPQNLEMSDLSDPFFRSIFKKKQDRINMPFAKQLVHTFSNRSLISYPDGSPFLFSKKYGLGTVYFFTSPIEDSFTNFHQHALCVPFFYQIALMSSTIDRPMFYRTGQEGIQISAENKIATDAIHLLGDGYDVIPNHTIRYKDVILDLPKDRVGSYEIHNKEGQLARIVINPNKLESETNYYEEDELKKLFSSQKNISVFGDGSMNQTILDRKLSGASIPMWKYCVLLSLLFVVIEILLIRFLV